MKSQNNSFILGDDLQLQASLSSLFSKKENDCVDDFSFPQGSPINGVKCLPEGVSFASQEGEVKNGPEENPQINKIFNQGSFPPEILKEKYKKNSNEKLNNKQTWAARHFQLTQNHLENWPETFEYLLGLKQYHWAIATKEKGGKTGHEHIHIYIQFTGPIRLSIKKLRGAHAEKLRGTPQQNIDYILKKKNPELKGDIFFEETKTTPWGIKNDEAEEGSDDKYKEISYGKALELPKEELYELPFSQKKNIEDLINRKESSFNGRTIGKKVKVLYLYGDSGVGKSIYARWLFRDTLYDNLKFEGTFWHGVSQNDNPGAIYDDFRDSHMSPSEFINFIDYQYHTMNIKCGSVINKYKYIIITSVFPPTQLWKNYQDKKNEDGIETAKQWLRRMKSIDMEEYYRKNPGKLQQYLKDLGYIEDPAKIEEDADDPFKEIVFDKNNLPELNQIP